MKRFNIFRLAGTLLVAGLMAPGCEDMEFDGIDTPESTKGYVVFNLSMAPGTRYTRANGESNNENVINTIDLFFYDEDADENVKAKLAQHEGSISRVAVSVSQLTDIFPAMKCKVVAVANCNASRSLSEPTLGELKQIGLSAKNTQNGLRDFRQASAPLDFVMTNFGQTPSGSVPNTVVWTEDGGEGTIELKRVAAKIRVALALDGQFTDDEGKIWTADDTDMRLFISNGVTKGRLDGAHIDLTEGTDYYSIVTSGSKGDEATETGDYYLAHEITDPGATPNGAPSNPSGEDYKYYNEVPYYSYPNSWENSMLSTTQTTLTIVVPWSHKEGNKETYRPTYYTVPVNNGTTIESNKYYYLRLHIGMMGSVTPEKPMEVPMQCEVADWGYADNTEADIRPVRFLIFNDTEFEMNNTNEIRIPFSSTHDCKVESFEGVFYNFFISGNGLATEMNFNDATNYQTYNGRTTSNGQVKGEGKFYNYKIEDNTLIFNHNFFDVYGVNSSSLSETNADGLARYKVNTITLNISNPKKEDKNYHRLFSKFVVKLKVRHDSGNTNIDQNYTETITLTILPAIYLNSENIPSGARDDSWETLGWMYVNGYHSTKTGGLEQAGRRPRTGDVRCLTTFTVTQLNDEEAAIWTIDDPRSNYINNDLSGSDHLTDLADNTTQWSGWFDGTQSDRSSVSLNGKTYSGARTMWQYFDKADPVTWGNNQVWKASEDKAERALKYYYPTAESQDKIDVIAPKIVFASYHMYSDVMNRETARRRCAALQIYGYPAGRWRLPTLSEIRLVKTLMTNDVVGDIFYSENSTSLDRVGTAWSNIGPTGNGITQGTITGNSYVRCVYDQWYWEKNGGDRIPDRNDWYYFTWGDRPKENPLLRGAKTTTVDKFLKEHAPGNYSISRDGNQMKRFKMK